VTKLQHRELPMRAQPRHAGKPLQEKLLRRANLTEIETRWGYRAFELWQGDITSLDFQVDVLGVSAFANDYEPTTGSVIGSLKSNLGIDVATLRLECQLDWTQAFGCWVSKEIPNSPFRRILCVEILGTSFDLREAIENVFAVLSALEAKGFRFRSIALPLLGAGQQEFQASEVMGPLLEHAFDHMLRSPCVDRIVFVAHDVERAQALDKAMNLALGRTRIILPTGELVAGVRKEIIKKISCNKDETAQEILDDISRLLQSKESRFFEIGITGRRLAEFITNHILTSKKPYELWKRIDNLAQHGVSDWMRSYMHMLRIFGNEHAHVKDSEGRKPPSLSEADFALCLFCIQRLLDFWLDLSQGSVS
jgi:hypothetical protein